MKLSNLITEPDNVTLCPVRLIVWIGVAGYHLGILWGVYAAAIKADMPSIGLYVQHIVTLAGIGGLAVGGKSLMKGDAPHD